MRTSSLEGSEPFRVDIFRLTTGQRNDTQSSNQYARYPCQMMPGYDGGDCCECTCVSTENYTCGDDFHGGYACIDPSAACVDDDDITSVPEFRYIPYSERTSSACFDAVMSDGDCDPNNNNEQCGASRQTPMNHVSLRAYAHVCNMSRVASGCVMYRDCLMYYAPNPCLVGRPFFHPRKQEVEPHVASTNHQVSRLLHEDQGPTLIQEPFQCAELEARQACRYRSQLELIIAAIATTTAGACMPYQRTPRVPRSKIHLVFVRH